MDEKQRKAALTGVLLLAAIVLFLAGLFVLPDPIIMQGGENGATMARLPGLGIPFILSAVFLSVYWRTGNKQSLAVAIVGIVLNALTWWQNLA